MNSTIKIVITNVNMTLLQASAGHSKTTRHDADSQVFKVNLAIFSTRTMTDVSTIISNSFKMLCIRRIQAAYQNTHQELILC